MISEGLRGYTGECKEKKKDNQDRLLRYIKSALHTHDGYAFGYFFCEILNFANVVSGMLKCSDYRYCGFHQFILHGKSESL
jgi:hypothetical protein